MNTDIAVDELYPRGRSGLGLAEAFDFPAGPEGDGTNAWVRAVFVASIDGAATIAGRAGGLGNDRDAQIFALNRALADVILVGAGTARIEGYGPAEDDPRWRHLRAGRGATAPIAVVSRRLDLDFDAPLFTEAPESARTIVVTCAEAPALACEQAGKVAEVIVAGGASVNLPAAIAALRSRGFARIVCEGGPRLFTDLVRAGGLDELCLTRSPRLVAGTGTRILSGPEFDPPASLKLAKIFATPDSFLYCVYRRT